MSVEKKHKTKEVTEDKEPIVQEEDDENEEVTEEGTEDDEEEEDDEDGCAIDLSQNEVYRGVCTLFEDAEGNNILEYISLLHTELIGINKSMENLRGIRKDLSRLADIAELLVKSKKDVFGPVSGQVSGPVSSGASVVSSATSHHDKSERSKKSSKV